MIVTRETFDDAISEMSENEWLALDTETTGLKPYHGDRLFSIIVSNKIKAWYFNFNDYPDLDESYKLDAANLKDLGVFLSCPSRKFFLHNAKFDMHILRQSNITLGGFIHCTMITARLLNNERMGFSLNACLKDIGLEKDDRVEELIKEDPELSNTAPAKYRKNAKDKFKYYNLVPFELIVPYGEQDVLTTYALGVWQRKELENLHTNKLPDHASIMDAYNIEASLLHVVVDMEAVGAKIDRDFCLRAAAYEEKRQLAAEALFKEKTGKDFLSSGKVLTEVFAGKEEMVTTEKGNNSFTSDVLQGFGSEEAKLILEIRDAYSRQNFYLGFLDAADKDDVIHASFNQTGTKTGRFSSSNPNLQNLTKEEGEDLSQEFVVRRAFVPREGYFLAMFDYDQVEYRMMLDYAGALGLIKKVQGGLDVHQATADVAGISRHDAKTTNFTVLYGGGISLLASRLKKSEQDATVIRAKIFEAAPEIRQYMNLITKAAEQRTYIVNWAGFRANFPDPKFCYRAPNSHIQGGCAYVVKAAMIKVWDYLRDKRSKLIMTIHDEIVVEVHKTEVYILPVIQEILESIFPYQHLKLTAGIDHSFKSLADKVAGCPSA